MTIKEQIDRNIKVQGRKFTWLAGQLGMSRRLLYYRMEFNNWTQKELDKLKELKFIS